MKQAIGVFLLIVLIYSYSIFQFSTILSKTFSFSDYRAQYTGAAMIQNGIRSNFYSLDTQYVVQKKLFLSMQRKYLLPFLSPPPVALILSPLALLPVRQGYVVLGFTLLSVLFVISFIAYRLIYIPKKVQKLLHIEPIDLLIVIAVMMPLWLSIFNSQLSIIWTLILLTSFLLVKKNKPILSGFILAFIVLKPHLLIVPLIFFIIKKEWRIIIGMFLGCGILILLSFYLIGWRGMVGYFQLLTQISINGASNNIDLFAQPTLRGFLHFLFDKTLSSRTIDMFWIVGAGVVFFTTSRYWKKTNNSHLYDLQWALMLVVSCFTSAHMHYHDLSILLIFIIIILNHWFLVLNKKDIVHREIFRHSKVIALLVVLVCSESLLYVKYFIPVFYFFTLYYLHRQIKIQLSMNKNQSLKE